jgi:hypothetical protein
VVVKSAFGCPEKSNTLEYFALRQKAREFRLLGYLLDCISFGSGQLLYTINFPPFGLVFMRLGNTKLLMAEFYSAQRSRGKFERPINLNCRESCEAIRIVFIFANMSWLEVVTNH